MKAMKVMRKKAAMKRLDLVKQRCEAPKWQMWCQACKCWHPVQHHVRICFLDVKPLGSLEILKAMQVMKMMKKKAIKKARKKKPS